MACCSPTRSTRGVYGEEEEEGLVDQGYYAAEGAVGTTIGATSQIVGMGVLGATAVVGGTLGFVHKGLNTVVDSGKWVVGAGINSDGEHVQVLQPSLKSAYDVDKIREVCGPEALAKLLAEDAATEELQTEEVDPRAVAEAEWRRVQWGPHSDADWMLLYKPVAALHVYIIGAVWLALFLFDTVLTLVLNKVMAVVGKGRSRSMGSIHPTFVTSLEAAATDDELWSETRGGVPPFVDILLAWLKNEKQSELDTVEAWRLESFSTADNEADPDFGPAVKILQEPGCGVKKWRHLLGLIRVGTSLLLLRKFLLEMEGGLFPKPLARQLARSQGRREEFLPALRNATPSVIKVLRALVEHLALVARRGDSSNLLGSAARQLSNEVAPLLVIRSLLPYMDV